MNKYCKDIFFMFVLALLAAPEMVFAQAFSNPLRSELSSISKFTEAFVQVVVYLLFPLAVVSIVYSGFLFVAAQGNSDGLKKAKTNFLWTVIGVALLLGAVALATLIDNTISPILSG
ncbi:TrbC/VirB2 family protein [Candidatus Kaiserbacteria bacterium]|nr:MAG: TrbC/VirB2 family protein [Candidatus Kaiserbacteria bacterium]